MFRKRQDWHGGNEHDCLDADHDISIDHHNFLDHDNVLDGAHPGMAHSGNAGHELCGQDDLGGASRSHLATHQP